jgi:hypothetical protein
VQGLFLEDVYQDFSGCNQRIKPKPNRHHVLWKGWVSTSLKHETRVVKLALTCRRDKVSGMMRIQCGDVRREGVTEGKMQDDRSQEHQ